MTKVVQLSDEAYRRLKMSKRGAESFSDVILRRFPALDLRGLQKLPRENLRWWKRWHEKIDTMDTPRSSR